MDMTRLSALPYFMERFHDSVARYPRLPMLVDARHPEGLTRAEVDELSARVYAYLKRRGVGKEDMVMICLPRGAEIVVAMYGVWKAGAALTAAEDDLPPERLAFIKADCGCKLVIDASLWPEIMRTPPLDGFETAGDHDAAFAIYTSGSTGEPKGILQEYGCFRMYALTGPRPSETPEEAFAETIIFPFNTLVGIHNAIKHLSGLESLHILPKEIGADPQRLNRYFTEHDVAHTFLPPSVLRAIGGDLSPAVRFVAVGGEGANGLYLDGVTLENGYSMSEAGVPVCTFIIDRPYAQCPVGKPTTDLIRLRLLDPEGREVSPGDVGEICFENPFFRGYINRPEETRAALRDELFHSGDLGRWDENGNLVVTGRAGDMIKVAGNRVEPGEIEAAFRKITGKDWCAVKGFEIGTRTLLCLYYQGESDLDASDLRRELGAYLPGYMIPARFQRVESIPLLATGKTDKAALPAPDFAESRPPYVPPVTETEQALCRAFETVFEIEPIGLDDDFFDLGGDSLYATSIMVESDLDMLTVQDIYTGGTPKQIAALYERHLAQYDAASAEAEELLQRTKAHFLTPHQLPVLSYTHLETYSLPQLYRFPAEIDAERLCDAFNSALANRTVLSMILERGPSGEITQRYDPAGTVRASVHTLTEAEFQDRLIELKQPFQMFGAPLCHAGIYRTEQNVYLFLDVHHIIADGSSFGLLYDDLVRAWRGEKLELDTYCTYLARERKLLDSDENRNALQYLTKRYLNASWCRSIRHDVESPASGGIAISPFRRMLTHAEAEAFESRIGHSRNTLFMAVALLTLYKAERQQSCLLLWGFNNRTDKVNQNAFGYLVTALILGVTIRDSMTIRELLREILNQKNASIASSMASGGMRTSDRSRGFSVIYETSDITTPDGLNVLGGQPMDTRTLLKSTTDTSSIEALLFVSETPQIIAPILMMDQAFYSAEKRQATLDTADDLLNRLLALEHPENTTVGELLG